MVTFQDVQDAPWMSQENEDLSYSLPVYWSDKSSHGDVLTSSVFPQLATWTTRLVLLYYNDHFPWEWLQGQAGVEEKTGFWDLMISQWLITVPCLLILLFGIGIFTFLVYYYCCKKEKALTKASLRDHKQHRKWAVSLLFVGSCLTILPSAMLFQQTVDPVLRYGVTTLANISIFTLEDLQIYKNKIGIDVKYFFNEYLIKNFETLINYDNIVEVLQSGVNYGNLSEAVSERLVQIEDNLSQISGIKLNLSDIFNTTSALAEDMAMQVESLDDSLVRLQNSCHMISRVACYNHTDILFAPPQTDMMEVFIDQLHSTLTYIDLERLENVAKLHKHLTSKLLRQNSITASISDIQSALIQDGRYFDTRYDVEQHLSESGEFIEKSKLTWENVNYLQTKHFTVAYLSFLTMTLTAAGYSIVLLFSFLFAVSGVRYSEFPCYRRSYLSTYSANIMSIANNLVIFLVLPVAVCTAAALIGGTMATVLADAVKTYTIFDYWVDRLPSINHIFTVDDFILHIPSYKTLVQLCAANNPGLLSVINATLPNITISLMQTPNLL